jgi:hypothetical protein
MSLRQRLKKIEDSVGQNSSALLITLYEDDKEEEILKRLKTKYGKHYSPNIILKRHLTREEARRNQRFFYTEIE